jgi:hypothetical protein
MNLGKFWKIWRMLGTYFLKNSSPNDKFYNLFLNNNFISVVESELSGLLYPLLLYLI